MILVLNRSPISADFPIVRFIGDQKTALPGESQVYIQNNYTSKTNTLFKKDVTPGKKTSTFYKHPQRSISQKPGYISFYI